MELRIRDVNSELHTAFKVLCVKQKKTIQVKIIELMQRAVAAEGE